MKKFLLVCTILMILVGCKKQVVKVSPSITSVASTSSITATSATISGAISDDGGDPITARGVVYGLNPNPTISDSKTSDGTGIGSFTSNISGLLPGKTYYIRIYATNSIGTTYGDQVTITTTKVAPTIGTGTSNSSITTTSAIITGSVAADGGDAITAKGVVYSLTNPPTISDSKTNEGSGTGNFTSTITGLSPGKVYYFRTYATNSVGTTYGDLITLTSPAIGPTVTTTAASNVTSSTAASGGSISNDGGANITAKGVCWGTAQNPTTALTTKTNEGSGTTTFTSAITGLSPNTVYYIRAYATNSMATTYGAEVTFTTLATGPTVTTATISAIATTTATGGGNVTLDGGSAVTARGICWSTTTTPTTALTTKTSDNTGTGAFTSLMTGLTPGTTYYVRAYATNSMATTYGAEVTFATQVAGPTVTTASITAVTSTTATGGGNVTSDGGATVTARGICWSTSTGPTTALTTKTSNNSGTGAFTSLMTGLTPGTTYYVRAYATNSAGNAYGVEISFTSTSTNGIVFNPNLTYGSLTDIDANIYKTIQIGTQIWMAENLKTTKYKDGTTIPLVTDNTVWTNLTTPGYCWYNNDAATNRSTYGALYNWFTVNTGKLCPTGWHVPGDAEWTILTTYLGGESVAGVKLKETGISHWPSSFNTAPTNSTGFTAVPSGYRYYWTGEFINKGFTGSWWASSEYSSWSAWIRGMSWENSVSSEYIYKESGFSVRCVLGELPQPTVTTSSISGITATSAISGGSISSDGGASITAKGICWSTSSSPTTTNSTTNAGTGTASFTGNLTGLAANTTYYVRAYATNSAGTAYGAQVNFTTASVSGGTATDADGNTYSSVTIGTQVWMTSNLMTTKYKDGTSIPLVTDGAVWLNLSTPAYCWYDNLISNKSTYGALYNWFTVNTSKLCPTGWHVPSDAEWTTLTTYLGGLSVAGGKLKSTGTTLWQSSNTGATNESGFTALPGGYHSDSSNFYYIGLNGLWWSSTAASTTKSWGRRLYNISADVTSTSYTQQWGMSVRCLKD